MWKLARRHSVSSQKISTQIVKGSQKPNLLKDSLKKLELLLGKRGRGFRLKPFCREAGRA